MNKPQLNKALSVGALVAIAGAAFLVAFTFFKKGGYSDADSYVVHAYFADATGLTWKSRVQIAGIQIGEVDQIALEGQRARLALRIKKGIDLHTDACLTKTFPSALLPDALLDVSSGSMDAPLLQTLPVEARELTCVREAASVQKLMDSLTKVAAEIQLVASDLSKAMGGEHGSMREIIENISNLTRKLDQTVTENSGKLSRLLDNAEAISSDVRDVTGSEKERVKAIVKNIEVISQQLRHTLASTQALIDGAEGPGAPAAGTSTASGKAAGPSVAGAPSPAGSPAGPAAAAAPAGAAAVDQKGMKQAIAKANDSLARLDALLAKLQEGESVAGRLLTDEKLGRKVGDAIDTYANYVDNLNRMQVEVRLRSEWLLNQTAAKTYFGIRILPRPDKYFLVEVVSDPRGIDTMTTTTTTVHDPAAPSGTPDQTLVTTSSVHEQKLTFSLQMAKRYGPIAFRAGIIESSGGVGSDLYLLDDRLQVSVSVYQFSRPFEGVFPRAKVWVNYNFMQHFYVTAGTDDFLNRWQTGRYPGGPQFSFGNDLFFGGGIFFTDDDLKTLIGMGAASAVTPATK